MQPHEVAFWLNMVLLLVLVPLQCYAEELVFRGYLMQTIGRWLKNPAWAILLPAPFFMLAHGYDLWGQASIVVMAVLAGFLCWYTGGLEAAIGMHVMNNITTMAMGMFANTDPLQMQSSGTPTDFAMVLATEVLYTAAICWFTHYHVHRAGSEAEPRARAVLARPGLSGALTPVAGAAETTGEVTSPKKLTVRCAGAG